MVLLGNTSNTFGRVARIAWLVILVSGIVSCRREAEPAQPAVDSGDAVAAGQEIAQADQFYTQREDLSKVRLAIAMLRQARIADYGNYDAAWKLSKFNYYLGSHTTDDRERESAFREGIDAGRIAVQLQKDRAEGHFWLGANYGGDAEHSTLAGLANIQDIKNEMETVIKLDEKYEGASAYLVLGEVYLEAPRVLGGSVKTAIDYFEKGLKLEPNNSSMRLSLAQAYHQDKREKDALSQIEYLSKMTPDAEHEPEYKEALQDGRELKDEIEKKG